MKKKLTIYSILLSIPTENKNYINILYIYIYKSYNKSDYKKKLKLVLYKNKGIIPFQ